MNKFAKYREAAGYLQKDIANALGVDRTTVSKWETGEANPRAKLLVPLAKLLKCSVDDLLKCG